MADGNDNRQLRDQASQESDTSDDFLYSVASSSDETSGDSQDLDEANTMSDEETSDNYLYSETSSSDETSVDSQDLEWHQIREYDLVENLPNLYKRYKKKQKVGPKRPKCDSKECIISCSGNFALYLCYVCNLLLCGQCLLKHDKTHEFVSVESETNERRRMAEMFVGRMRSERLGRGINFDREGVRVHGQVNVKHRLDKRDCTITGLSPLKNKRWVAVDRFNHCIKIFCSVSNTLLRYIKFGSLPWDVTEIQIKQKPTDPDSASGSKTDISGAARDEPDKHCLLAVTFPDIEEIWFIDVSKITAIKTKTIQMDKKCLSVDFNEDKIFALCRDDVSLHHLIYILSKDGNQLKVIHSSLYNVPWTPGSLADFADIAVHNGRIYYTNHFNKRVSCINVEDGKTIPEFTLEEGSRPTGISVDHNNGVVYVCGLYNKVYKLSPDLREYEPLSLDTDYTQYPHSLCFINSKLFLGHYGFSSLNNVVSVVQVQT